MKKFIPFIVVALGVAFILVSMFLRNGTEDAEAAITNVASTFMLFAGGVCVVGGCLIFFLRHDHDFWSDH